MAFMETGLNPRVVSLFLIFSRLEYALSRSKGFARKGAGNAAYGNLWKLSEELGQAFFDEQRADPSKAILWTNPPGQWVAVEGEDGEITAVWEERTAPQALKLSLEPVAWVRNCVIHGESQDMIERYIALVEAAISVLDAVVERCSEQQALNEVAEFFTQARPQEV